MTPTEKAQELLPLTYSRPTVTGILDDGTKVKLRLFKTSTGEIGYYKKGSRIHGYYLSNYTHLVDIKPIVSKKTPEQKWINGWNKVKTMLQKSGLWEEVVEDIDLAIKIGYQKMNEADAKYWELSSDDQLAYFQTNYPTLIKLNDQNKPYIKTSCLWSYSKIPRVKKMRFDKSTSRNTQMLQSIHDAMEQKKKLHLDGRTNYDISFEYAPQKNNKAWYAEQFKGCGNGHYYIALNSSHALFREDD